MPSWKISVASGEMLPARMPPMSQKWPQVCGEGDELAAVEHGRGEDHVRRVRHAAARAVAVVVPVEIAGTHGRRSGTGRKMICGEVAEERHHRAAHHASARVEDAGEVVVLLADERRHRGALDDRLHVASGPPAARRWMISRVTGSRAPGAAGAGGRRRVARFIARAPWRRITRLPARSTRGALPGRDHRRGVELLDDGRARHDRAGAELVTLDARARLPAARRQSNTRRRDGRPRGGAARRRGTGCGSAARARRRPRAA